MIRVTTLSVGNRGSGIVDGRNYRFERASFGMAIPGYLHLGFFAEDSIGEGKEQPLIIPGPQAEAFEGHVRGLLGELPVGEESESPLYRDKFGVVTVSLWELIDQRDLVRRLLEVQSCSECQAVESRGFSSHRIHPDNLAAHLRYYVEEFREVVAGWQAFQDKLKMSERGG